MILREMFYIDPDTRNVANDLRYNPSRDNSQLHRSDTRKTRLTLKQLNELKHPISKDKLLVLKKD